MFSQLTGGFKQSQMDGNKYKIKEMNCLRIILLTKHNKNEYLEVSKSYLIPAKIHTICVGLNPHQSIKK